MLPHMIFPVITLATSEYFLQTVEPTYEKGDLIPNLEKNSTFFHICVCNTGIGIEHAILPDKMGLPVV